jgi:hypothetical protein
LHNKVQTFVNRHRPPPIGSFGPESQGQKATGGH